MKETCDVTDETQLIIFVRYIDKIKNIFADLLIILPILGNTREKNMFKGVMDYFHK